MFVVMCFNHLLCFLPRSYSVQS